MARKSRASHQSLDELTQLPRRSRAFVGVDELEFANQVVEPLVDLEPEELTDALVEALVPAEAQTDDVAVLVVRFDGRRSALG